MSIDENLDPFDAAIAVVGMAAHLPGARDVDQFWRNLRDGVESTVWFSDQELEAAGVEAELLRDPGYVRSSAVLEEMELFDAGFFGFSPKDAAIMDPQHRQFLECAWEALEYAGHAPGTFDGSVGVFAGCGTNAYLMFNLLTNAELLRSVGFFLLRHTGNDKDFLATRVSYNFDLKGPSVTVQTACSTSLVAIHLACQSLLNGECDMALAGGVTIRQPHRVGYLYKEGEILSPDGHCRAFDVRAQGTILGSGAGVVVLRRLQDALADGDTIHAIVRGSAFNNDGSGKVGYLAPSVDGQARVVAEALAMAGVSPDTVSYVEAHGTGTLVGDPIEVSALIQAFRAGTQRTGYCGLGSVKTNIGHLDTAAGVASFIKVVQALRHGALPPSLHYESPNPAIDFEASPFFVVSKLSPWASNGAPRRAGVSSLGVGGTNVHAVLEEAPAVDASGPSRAYQLLLLSGRSRSVVAHASGRLATHLELNPDVPLADVAYTLACGRKAFKVRQALICRDAAEAVDVLVSGDAKRLIHGEAPAADRPVAFLFAGGGAQYPGMGRDLYEAEPVYRSAVDACLGHLADLVDFDLRPLLFPPAGREAEAARELERPTRALPALFTTQFAGARLWMSWGITPGAMIGHSMGEYTAACLAGVLSPADALAVVVTRARLFETLPAGAMTSVPLAPDALAPSLSPELSIAAVNGPELCVASGPVAAIAELERRLARDDIESNRIHIAVAAHSRMLEPILKEFGEFLQTVRFRAPTIPFASNLSGDWITPEEATDSAYWVRHLRNTVRFSDGLSLLLSDPDRVLLEVGPGRTLATLARLQPSWHAAQDVVTSLRHPQESVSDVAFVLGVLGRLWTLGVPVDLRRFYAEERRRRVPLPTYPFERQPHYIAAGRSLEALAPAAAGELSREPDLGDWFWEPSWRRSLAPAAPPPVPAARGGDPVVIFNDETGLARKLGQRLRSSGRDVVHVTAADHFANNGDGFSIRPGHSADYDTMIESLYSGGRSVDTIVYARPLGELPGDADQAEDAVFYGLLYLAQAIGRAEPAKPLRLCVLTDGMQHVAGEDTTDPRKALVIGPVRVIPREYPGIQTRSVDVAIPPPGTWQEDLLLGRLAAEISHPGDERIVAYRGRDRWTESWDRVRVPAGEEDRVRDGGVYLITGGLGGLGLAVAEELARRARARLVLVGRSRLPSRSEWDALLASDPESREAAAIRKLKELEALGAQVEVVAADVSDAACARAVVAHARERFGELHGVVHAAGVLDDGLAQLKTRESAAAVLAPKVRGTLALEAALADTSLDFMLLFSSRSAVSGIAGQIDYTAANAFLDAYARHRAMRDQGFVLSIAWSAWLEVGMAARLGRETGASRPQADREEISHPLFDWRIRGESEIRLGTRFRSGRHWMVDEHRIRGGDALIPGAGYLEIARSGFAEADTNGDGATLELRDVFFVSPFMVRRDVGRDLEVCFRAHGESTQFVIRGRPPEAAGRWQDHARGTIRRSTSDPAPTHDVGVILGRCKDRVLTFEADHERAHLDLGPRWANLKRLGYGRNEAVATLELRPELADDLARHPLHPALLDVATACAKELIPGFDEARDFFVPASYSSLLVRAPLPARVHSHIRYRGPDSAADSMAVFDVTILGDDGRELVDAREFIMIRVDDRTRLGEAAQPSPGPAHAEADDPVADEVPLLEDGIRPAEGMEILHRVLDTRMPPHLILSPRPLPGVLARFGQAPASPPARAEARRIDTAPIEARLLDHAAVQEAAVQAFRDRSGGSRIVAFVAFRPGEHATVSELRRFLRQSLTEELVPQNFVEVNALPRNDAGEVDPSGLMDPFGAGDDFVAPRTATEQVVARVWAELLGMERVAVHDNFLDNGGHSLLAMRAILRIEKETGVRIGPSSINLLTLEQIAAEIDAATPPEEGRSGQDPETSPRETARATGVGARSGDGFSKRLWSTVKQSVAGS